MKIKVVSETAVRAEQIAQILRAGDPELEVFSAAGSTENLPQAINGSGPGLLMLDDVRPGGLDAIARLAHTHPEVETIVISNEQSPAFLLRAMQVGVREVLPSPVHAPAMQAAVNRLVVKRRRPAAPAQLGEVFAFMACKGGSGASFIAANLAHVLSQRDGRTVALIDLDLQFGDAMLMVSDQRHASDIAEVARNIGRLDAELMRSAMVQLTTTLSVLPAPADLTQALEVKAGHVEAIIKQARQMFDFVVLDVGRSVDQVTLQALDQATRIFPVLQLSLPQIRDAKRLRGLFRSLGYPPQKIHWLVNRYKKGGDLSLDALEQALGSKVETTLPNHFASVSASVNQGVPIGKLAPANPVARALADLAQSVAPAEAQKREGWFSTLFSHSK